MPNTRDIELAVGRALAKAYPWLTKVRHPPRAGLIDCAALLVYPDPAASEPQFERFPLDKLTP